MLWNSCAADVKALIGSPIVAISALLDLFHKQEDKALEEGKERVARVIIDKDGNATLNFKNPEVKEALEKQVRLLAEANRKNSSR